MLLLLLLLQFIIIIIIIIILVHNPFQQLIHAYNAQGWKQNFKGNFFLAWVLFSKSTPFGSWYIRG